ncbi:MAG: hypothetical protein HC913_17585 [Microscillaceae bacterium]|nr:hypothetical protein [Microscillaceae bacterium]
MINLTDGNQPMPGELCIFVNQPTSNDLCAGAQEISVGTCNYPFEVSNLDYNTENVPLASCGGFTVFRDAWVEFPVQANQQVLIEYFSEDSDAVLALYDGNCGSLNELVCSGNSAGVGQEERLIYTATADDVLYLRVMKIDGAGTMTGTLCVSDLFSRDDCAAALAAPVKLQTGGL